MRQYMAKIEWHQLIEGKNLQETWETFEGIINDTGKKYIPCKKNNIRSETEENTIVDE